jgi:hypothetical protein
LAVITDNGSNVIKAFRELVLSNEEDSDHDFSDEEIVGEDDNDERFQNITASIYRTGSN